MVTRELLLIAKAVDQVSGPLGKASGGVKEFGAKATESDDQLSGMSSTAKILGGVLAGAVTVQTAKAAYELGKLGAQSLRTKANFESISGGAGSAADNLDAMRTATRRALSEQEMMTAANQMLQMGLVSTSDELEEASGMATRLGSAMGKDAGESLESFTLMLANQSIPRLDTFGISAGAVRAEMADLAKQFPEMSKETRFMTATMNQGREAMERLGPAIEDDMLAAEQLEASMADLKVMAAEMLAPAMAAVAKTVVTATRAFQNQIEEVDTLTAAYGEEAVGLAMLADRREQSTEHMDALRERYEAVEAAVTSGATQIDGWSSSLMDSGVIIEDVTEAVGDYEAELDILKGAIDGPVGQANEDYRIQVEDIRQAIRDERATLQDLRLEHGQYDDAVIESQGKINDLEGELVELATAHEESMARIRFSMLETLLARDGYTEAEIQLLARTGKAWGIYDEETATYLENILGYVSDWEEGVEGSEETIVNWGTTNTDTLTQAEIDYRDMQETFREESRVLLELSLNPVNAALIGVPLYIEKAERAAGGSGENIAKGLHPGTLEAQLIAGTLLNIPSYIPVSVHTTYSEEGRPPTGPWTPGQAVPDQPLPPAETLPGGGGQQFQHGTPYVPYTGYAYLHQGEAVLTREENQQRMGEGGFRVTIHNHFGRDSVRSEDDIRTLVRQIRQSTELQGIREMIV